MNDNVTVEELEIRIEIEKARGNLYETHRLKSASMLRELERQLLFLKNKPIYPPEAVGKLFWFKDKEDGPWSLIRPFVREEIREGGEHRFYACNASGEEVGHGWKYTIPVKAEDIQMHILHTPEEPQEIQTARKILAHGHCRGLRCSGDRCPLFGNCGNKNEDVPLEGLLRLRDIVCNYESGRTCS